MMGDSRWNYRNQIWKPMNDALTLVCILEQFNTALFRPHRLMRCLSVATAL